MSSETHHKLIHFEAENAGFFCFLILQVLHPLFMVIGFIIISGEGILINITYKVETNKRVIFELF